MHSRYCVEVEERSGVVGEEMVAADGEVGGSEGLLGLGGEVELEGDAGKECEEVGVG